MNATTFLLLNVALAFYNVGAIWAHELDIFRSWVLLDPNTFREVQSAHWRKLPYWIFTPVGLALVGGFTLIWYRPAHAPLWAVWSSFLCQLLSIILTAMFWGRWQAKLAQDPRGAQSPYLALILRTHWIRTLLINAYALILLVAAADSFA